MITIFPHLDYEGFSWEYMAGKPSSDFAEAHRVVSMELLVDRSGGDAIGAETVEDSGRQHSCPVVLQSNTSTDLVVFIGSVFCVCMAFKDYRVGGFLYPP